MLKPIHAYISLAVCAAALLLPFAVMAEEVSSEKPPSGGTVVTLSASDQKNVEQDQLGASLRIEMDERDPRKLQDTINKAMQTAIEIAKAEKDVKVSTGQYYVYSYDPNPSPRPLSHAEQMKRMIWKGSQTIDLQSKNAQALLDVAGKIQEAGFIMNGLSYSLSSEKEESQKDTLLIGALQKIQKKADLVAKTLGKKGFEITEVNIEGANMPEPRPMMMKAMAMDASVAGAAESMAAPQASPGETTVSLSVSARVVLK